MGTNANGYEIRLTLLQLAKDMLFDEWRAQEHVRNTLSGGEVDGEITKDHAISARRPPSPTDIQGLAMELYEFVQRKDAPPRNPALGTDYFGGP